MFPSYIPLKKPKPTMAKNQQGNRDGPAGKKEERHPAEQAQRLDRDSSSTLSLPVVFDRRIGQESSREDAQYRSDLDLRSCAESRHRQAHVEFLIEKGQHPGEENRGYKVCANEDDD